MDGGQSRGRAAGRVQAAIVTIALLGGGLARAVSLPVRVYSALEGLPGNRVHRIMPDSRGFLWFATDRGLARFDGSRFIVYGAADGLPDEAIDDIAETNDGTLWVAADDALYRLDPLAPRGSPGEAPPFVRVSGASGEYPSPGALEPVGERDVRVGTSDGVFETRRGSLVRARPELPRRIWDDHAVLALARTASGEWTGTIDALWFTPAGGGDSRRFELREKAGTQRISALLRDRKGRLWIGTWGGLFVLEPRDSGDADPFDPGRRLSAEPVTALLERPDGTILATAQHALLEFPTTGAPRRTPAVELGALFEEVELRCLAEDPAGNLWIGTAGGGAVRIDHEGFLRFGREDGLDALRATALFARSNGLPCAQLVRKGRVLIACFDGDGFQTLRPKLPRESLDAGWGTEQLAFEDARGRLWLPTGEGLLRYPARARLGDLERTPPERVFDRTNGLAIDNVFRIFSAGDGSLWISTVSPESNLLARWRAESDRIELVSESDGLPRTIAVTAIGEDAGGEIWIGTNGGGVWRRRLERFERIGVDPTLSRCWITSIFRDRGGRIWVGTDRAGLVRVDAPEAAAPSARRLTTREGLSSMEIRGVAEDRFSRTYVLTSSGVDRFSAQGVSVDHFTSADGLPGGRLTAILGARDGAIWVAGDGGIAVLRPVAAGVDAPASVLFDGMEVSGERVPIPLCGRSRVTRLSLPASRNSLRFEIASLAWESRRSAACRYRLDARGPWSAVPPDRVIALPRLAPGHYRLDVESVDSAGVVGRRASAEFSIAAPIWRRPWFVLLAAAAAAVAATRIHRARIAQLMRVERIRTQIAADLHDDIGAGLSEVAVLAEVVHRRVAERDPESGSIVHDVASTARQLVDGMGEIVWATDPRRDDLGSLVIRLRHFAGTLAEARGVRMTVDAPGDLGAVPLAAGRRRDLYLLLKEAVHNAVRHSGAESIAIHLSLDRGVLRAGVSDDGRGFDVAASHSGHGLETMRRRAASIGARLDVDSAPGGGTRVSIVVPFS